MIAAASAASLSSQPPPLKPCLKSKISTQLRANPKPAIRRRSKTSGVCRAELVNDVPFAVAIGACVLNSVVFPVVSGGGGEDEDENAVIGNDDTMMAVMAIIGFIPYFNWLSWVFAWMDSGRQRYLVYSIVYLAPYFRTNLSLSPDESWLPIASIIICILHIQLEASIRNGDFEVMKIFSPKSYDKQKSRKAPSMKVKKKMELPLEQESRPDISGWGNPRKQIDDLPQLNENPDVDSSDKSK